MSPMCNKPGAWELAGPRVERQTSPRMPNADLLTWNVALSAASCLMLMFVVGAAILFFQPRVLVTHYGLAYFIAMSFVVVGAWIIPTYFGLAVFAVGSVLVMLINRIGDYGYAHNCTKHGWQEGALCKPCWIDQGRPKIWQGHKVYE